MIRIRVNGTPAPQGSKRHVGNGRMVEMSKAAGPWREAVRAETQQVVARRSKPLYIDGPFYEFPLFGPVSVLLVFAMPRPQSHYGRRAGQRYVKDSAPPFPAGRPDVDKLARAVLDGITAGGAIADDGQVAELTACKVWCGEGQAPGVTIEIEEMK